MIGPGWMPSRPVSHLKRRPLAYARLRRSGARKPHGSPTRNGTALPDEPVIFQTGPVELTMAILRSRTTSVRIRAMLAQWRSSSWSWLRPRTVPVMVAALGLVAVLASQNYLRHVPVASLHHVTSR